MEPLLTLIKKRNRQKGQLLVEILLTIALTAIMLPALLTGLFSSKQGKAQQGQRVQAVALMKEAEEITRSVKEQSWSTFALNGSYHPAISANTWALVPGSETINGLTRTITISDVYRDANGIIVTTGGAYDPSTKRVFVSVNWGTPFPSTVDTTVYLTRYNGNTASLQTTVSDFNSGSNSATIVTNVSGGEVTLGAGGSGDWCDPNLSIAALDLPKSGEALALTAIEGKAFAGTGLDSSGVSFADVTISNTNPPTTSLAGSFDGYKTNGVFGETNYAYLATDTNSKELVIIDLTQKVNGKYVESGYFNAPGNGDGLSVFVSGSTGYMTTADKLYNFDLTSKSGSRPIKDTDGVTLAGDSNKIFAIGNYIYAVTDSSSTQLQIIDTSNPTNLSVVGQAVLPAGSGKDVYINSSATRAYIANSDNKMYIIDVSVKTSNRPIVGTYSTGGMSPKGVRAATANKALIVGQSGEEYQVVNIINEANPVRCGGLNIETGITAVASVLEQDGDAYSYLLTRDATAEMKIIEGGPGGQFSTSGTFTSELFDPGSTVAYNYFYPTFTQPNQTSLKFQLAVASAVNGSCESANYTFVGPDGNTSTYYTEAGAISMLTTENYINPGRCMKYKAYFSTNDTTVAPTLEDVSINYSP